ncbi:MAG: hypothetical protein KF745_05165 [Phycisphaeraceae bacterium]|nr:hypothetical protein [Phycisphaeraceae bacterium]
MVAPNASHPGVDPAYLSQLVRAVAERARDAGVFGGVEAAPDRLTCHAAGSAAPAEYRLDAAENSLWVSLVTADRWLSQSIEADLVHTGDDLADLLKEELDDLDYSGPAPAFQHYRSEDKLFTFRSRLPVEGSGPVSPRDIETAATLLLGYEACFRRLGDMDSTEEE